jgi:hypothetical protein
MALNLGSSMKILLKTTPYLVLRIVVYGLVGLGTGIFVGLLILIAKAFGGIGTLIFFIGIAGLFGIFRLIREYVLYIIKAGHIAVITELIHKGELPPGVNQVEYGKQVVTGMFKEVSILFAVDQIVDGILKAFNRTVVRIADLLPIPGLDSVAKLVNYVFNFAVTYVDECILSYNFSRKNENIWASAKRGVILYAQNWKPIIMGAVWTAIINAVGAAVLIGIFAVPFGLIGLATANETAKFFLFAFAVTIGYSLKLAIINPLCMISMISTFNQAVAGQEPRMEWESKLETYSTKFKELKDKAVQSMRSSPQAQAPVSEPAAVCPQCSATLVPGKAFCSNCGASVAAPLPPVPPPPNQP